MRTKELIKRELFEISKRIKEILNNDGDANRNELLREAQEQYELTKEEQDKLRDLTNN